MKKEKKKKKKSKNSAFTLVELLVSITILGIIMVVAIPLIRNLLGNQVKQKFNTYRSSVEESARLYVQTYGDDQFGNGDGCLKLTLNELINKGFAKDIQMEDKTCNTDDSFVIVQKKGNRYIYRTSLACKTEGATELDEAMKSNEIDPSKIDMTKCNEPENHGDGTPFGAPMTISFKPTKYDGVDSQRVNIEIAMNGDVEISHNSIVKYAFATTDTPKDDVSWNNLNLNIAGKKATSVLLTPDKKTGKYYLFINANDLLNVEGKKANLDESANGSDCKKIIYKEKEIIRCGKYTIDNKKPDLGDTKITNSGSNLSDAKLYFDATDEKYTPKSNLRFCLELNNGAKKCAKNPNEPSSSELSYKKYGKTSTATISLADFIKTSDNSSENLSKATLYVADEAVNIISEEFTINKLIYHSNGGSGCASYKYAFNGLSWGTLCTPTRSGYTFLGWFPNKNLTGTEVSSSKKVTGDIDVYAKWQGTQRYTGYSTSAKTLTGVSEIVSTNASKGSISNANLSDGTYTFTANTESFSHNATTSPTSRNATQNSNTTYSCPSGVKSGVTAPYGTVYPDANNMCNYPKITSPKTHTGCGGDTSVVDDWAYCTGLAEIPAGHGMNWNVYYCYHTESNPNYNYWAEGPMAYTNNVQCANDYGSAWSGDATCTPRTPFPSGACSPVYAQQKIISDCTSSCTRSPIAATPSTTVTYSCNSDEKRILTYGVYKCLKCSYGTLNSNNQCDYTYYTNEYDITITYIVASN